MGMSLGGLGVMQCLLFFSAVNGKLVNCLTWHLKS